MRRLRVTENGCKSSVKTSVKTLTEFREIQLNLLLAMATMTFHIAYQSYLNVKYRVVIKF